MARQIESEAVKIPAKGLIVREPWVSALVDGRKKWELRGSKTAHRGSTAFIAAGSGLVLGEAILVDVVGPLDRDSLSGSKNLHLVDLDWETIALPYRATFAWVFENAVRYHRPIPYIHPRGAVIWVDLSKTAREVLADAGSGKTSVITAKASFLAKSGIR
ncbi:RNA-binding protein [Rhizobium leguminosarum]|uniref:RNA-binding protein n=1 Tax=Rhizobium leguminosarum TaxID=384 RepID=UPI000FF2CEF5|nr:RNA-binding protein [Rhizobium leguminosarum]RWY79148.1 RNA-binding protein [Rhizobium leguminosarum]